MLHVPILNSVYPRLRQLIIFCQTFLWTLFSLVLLLGLWSRKSTWTLIWSSICNGQLISLALRSLFFSPAVSFLLLAFSSLHFGKGVLTDVFLSHFLLLYFCGNSYLSLDSFLSFGSFPSSNTQFLKIYIPLVLPEILIFQFLFGLCVLSIHIQSKRMRFWII